MLYDFLLQYRYVFVWGTGEYLERYKMYLPRKINGYIDNDASKNGKYIDDIRIYSPKVLSEFAVELTVIIICSAYYDEILSQICDLGGYAAIYVEDVAILSEVEALLPYSSEKAIFSEIEFESATERILSVAGIHALFQINGCRRFIDAQSRIIGDKGIDSVEIAPIRFAENGRKDVSLLAIREKGQYKGLMRLERFDRLVDSFSGMIVHGLYYNPELTRHFLSILDSQIPVLYYTHDYYCVCTNRFLIHNNSSCIDRNGELKCEKCDLNGDQSSLRSFHQGLFMASNIKVVSPTVQMKKRIKSVYPGANCCVEPHLKYRVIKNRHKIKHSKLRIAFLGGRFATKGWDYYKCLCSELEEKYNFYYFGSEGENTETKMTFVRTTLDNENSMVKQLNKYSIDVACVLSLVPETYSFTFYEALEAGCYIVTTNKSGNVCKSVDEMKCGRIFDSYEDMREWFSNSERVWNSVSSDSVRLADVRDNSHFIDYLIWK